jgi:hypothetical protein
MKAFLIVLLLILAIGGLLAWSRYQAATVEIQAMNDETNRKDREIQLKMGTAVPVYTISAEGKTWTSKQRPIVTLAGTSFVDSETGQTIQISGTAIVEEK